MSSILDPNVFVEANKFINELDEDSILWKGLKKITPEYDDELGRRDYEYRSEGLYIGSEFQNGWFRISAIFLHLEGDESDGYDRFCYTGPLCIKTGTTKAQILESNGPAQKTGGDFEDEILGYQKP